MKQSFLFFGALCMSIVFVTGCADAPATTTDMQEDVMADEAMMKDDAQPTETSMMLHEGEAYDYRAELEDVTNGAIGALTFDEAMTGTAYARYDSTTYELFASFDQLVDPGEGYFYAGWLVAKAPYEHEVLSTGPLTVVDGMYVNEYTSDRDLTGHKLYVLTLEPDDNDPAPADHVFDGTFQVWGGVIGS